MISSFERLPLKNTHSIKVYFFLKGRFAAVNRGSLPQMELICMSSEIKPWGKNLYESF